MEDYYAILQVSRSASTSTIRESYRRLALRFHPDKNRNKSATSDFQRIVRAWEVLQDEVKRQDYDQECGWFPSWGKTPNFDDFFRRRGESEEIDPDVKSRSNRADYDTHSRQGLRSKQIQSWKILAQQEYLSRLTTWTNTRKRLIPMAQACRSSIVLRESQFNVLSNMEDCETILQFQKAIELSKSSGAVVGDPSAILTRLVSAREKFMARLSRELSEVTSQYQQLLLQLGENQRKFEHEEIDSQQLRIQEALQILGPRDLGPPLLIAVDRRLQAINRWESLAKIGSSQNLSDPSLDLSEGPWHSGIREWDRMPGEHKCSRCNKLDFHVILECGPARCPACGIVVCNECHRDLWLLRKYDEWIMSPLEQERDCFFTLDV